MIRKLLVAAALSLSLPSAAVAQNCVGTLPNTLANGTNADATQVMANFTYLLTCINSLLITPGNLGASVARQTVAFGPVTNNAGSPTFLNTSSATLSLSTSNLSSTAPLVVTAANGVDTTTGGPKDLVAKITSNITWTGLAPSATNYLYVTVASDGTVTTGSTSLAPIYQKGGTASTTTGQFTFNFGFMRGLMGNGTSAPQTYIVFVGQTVTNATGVTSSTEYAYRGIYDSSYTNTLPAASTAVSKSHNLGLVPAYSDFRIQNIVAEGNYAVGDEIGLGSMHASDGTTRVPTLSVGRMNASIVSTATPWIALNRTTGAAFNLTPANWKYRIVATRGW
jgi:hypothetical protein